MPLYDCECTQCGEFEGYAPIALRDEIECPYCGRKDHVRFLIKKALMVDSDIMAPCSDILGDGKTYTSKKKFMDACKAAGFEPRGDRAVKTNFREHYSSEEDIRATTQEAVRQLKWGMAPLTEKEKEWCKIQEQVLEKNS